jgi:hypothetical protein
LNASSIGTFMVSSTLATGFGILLLFATMIL